MSKRTMAIARATGMIGATLALAIGVTFAIPTATASLVGNTMATATAGLLVENSSGVFGQTASGFTFNGLVPGTESTPFLFDLKTTDSIPLAITAHVPVAPTYTGIADGGFSGVHLKFSTAGGTLVVDTTLAALLANQVVFPTPIPGNTTVNYKVTATIDPAVVTGSGATIGAFDIVFTGTQSTP